MRVLTFLKDITLKVNVIVQPEFEVVYYDATVKHFRHYVTGTPFSPVVVLFNP